jgi:hypothetical protein
VSEQQNAANATIQNHLQQQEEVQEATSSTSAAPMGRQKSTLSLGPRATQTLRQDRTGRRQLKKAPPMVVKIEDEEPFVNECAGQGEEFLKTF